MAFTDLTMAFADVDRAVYIDACCHLNRFGYSELIEEMVRAMEP